MSGWDGGNFPPSQVAGEFETVFLRKFNMFIDQQKAGQCPLVRKKMRAMNRCGATALAVGDVVAFDTDAADADTQALNGVGGVTCDNLLDAMFSNLVQAGANPKKNVLGVVVNLLGNAGADNTEVEVQLWGEVFAKVGGTDWGSAYASAGVQLMVDTTGANRRLIAATDGANAIAGFIGENIAEDLGASNKQQTRIVFNGLAGMFGPLGA